MKEAVENLYRKQLDNWELAANNYKALALVKTKQVDVDGWKYLVQFNPARIVSSSAKIDPQSIKERKCFLCREHLPTRRSPNHGLAPQGRLPHRGSGVVLSRRKHRTCAATDRGSQEDLYALRRP